MGQERSVFVSSKVSGTGFSVPDKVIPNSHFESYLETSDEWIRERTGIEQRRWVEGETTASDLAEKAALDAIKNANLTVDDIDGIILATVTPDNIFPSTAAVLQKKLGVKNGFAYDVNAVCTGFVYALVNADSLIKNGQAKNILVVGVDIYSRIIDKDDRGTCVLFGDGAGALVLSKTADGDSDVIGMPSGVTGSVKEVQGVYASELRADGAQSDILYCKGGSGSPEVPAEEQFIKMQGREVFKLAVRSLAEVSKSVLEKSGLEIGDVSHFVSHQANRRIILGMGKQLGVGEDKVPINVEKYGNTSAASIPILLAECDASGRIKPGEVVHISAFGGGVTWGAVVVRW